MRILNLFSLCLLLEITFAISCVNEDTGPQECDGSLSIFVDSTTPSTSCTPANGTISTSATGGKPPYQYSLNNGAKQPSGIFSNLSGGEYDIKVIDANGCENVIADVEVEDNLTLDIGTTSTADSDCSSNNGAIVASGSGGNAPYQFALNNGGFSATSTFSNLAAGTYSVKIQDASGCVKEKTESVGGPVSYQFQIKPILEVNCIKSGCHNGDNGATRNWSVFANVQAKAQGIKTKTGNRSMPADNPNALTQNQIDLIACWVDHGALNN